MPFSVLVNQICFADLSKIIIYIKLKYANISAARGWLVGNSQTIIESYIFDDITERRSNSQKNVGYLKWILSLGAYWMSCICSNDCKCGETDRAFWISRYISNYFLNQAAAYGSIKNPTIPQIFLITKNFAIDLRELVFFLKITFSAIFNDRVLQISTKWPKTS